MNDSWAGGLKAVCANGIKNIWFKRHGHDHLRHFHGRGCQPDRQAADGDDRDGHRIQLAPRQPYIDTLLNFRRFQAS